MHGVNETKRANISAAIKVLTEHQAKATLSRINNGETLEQALDTVQAAS